MRYVFIVFLTATVIFLTIPKFFDYKKKEAIIKNYLIINYNLVLNDYSSIEYQIFPLPNLVIKNTTLKLKDEPINFKSNNISIFLNFKNIYNYKYFEAKKILFEQNQIILNINDIKKLFLFFKEKKYKFKIQDLNLILKKNNKTLINLENINFSNYGYRKYHTSGKVLGRKFKTLITNNNQSLKFKLLDTGIKANFEFNEKDKKNILSGSSKINISNNLIRFDFNFDNNNFKIQNSNFRNKDLSFSLDSLVKFNPFFIFNSNVNIKEINKNFMHKINLEKILKNKQTIKKLNSEVNIKYKSKKYFSPLIQNFSTDLSLTYGRLVFSNTFLFFNGSMNCTGDTILIDEYPRLNFICIINHGNKKKLLRKFSISEIINEDPLNLTIQGSINLLNKKINFNKIDNNKRYLANKEDIKFFEETFEKTLLNEGFFKIFSKNKINEFLLEII